ncbi:MAG: sensor histidine kinase [Rariglobus sp.]|nr:HAMP domain-containing sensor histidine kinase [Rariglobus sp.]
MTLSQREQFGVLADYLATRRESLLLAWRRNSCADPDQGTGRSLSVGQFLDHIPEMLDAFELKLRSRQGGPDARTAEIDKKLEEVKHGLHRWQQGYRMKELINECGHLQLCLFDELDLIAAAHPELDRAVIAAAHRQILTLVNDTISESATQYQRMQQAEAAGHVGDLRSALVTVHDIERRRSTLFHQAVHDLRNDVAGVHYSAQLLERPKLADAERTEFAGLLRLSVQGLTTMLGELMDLARLEAGQEQRKITRFDVSKLITERCDVNQPIALEHGLFLEAKGPAELSVEGDTDKIGRLLQNLLTNAIKYTECGGVNVSWDADCANWWFIVKDTGPGLLSHAGSPLVVGLQEATASAKESDEKNTTLDGETSRVLPPPEGADTLAGHTRHQPGEGIGLSIVKRLCELLDASLEIATSAESGTTFRVVLPLRYPPTKGGDKA